VKTVVRVQLQRNAAGEIDRAAAFLVYDLATGREDFIWDAGVLAQIEHGGDLAYFDADWDGQRFSFGDRVRPPE
jgi:hypothetical protein